MPFPKASRAGPILDTLEDRLALAPAGRHRARVRRQARRHGASPGGFGTTLAQAAWLPVFKTLGADLYSRSRLLVSCAGTLVDATGEITDAATRGNIAKFVNGFVVYVRQRKT